MQAVTTGGRQERRMGRARDSARNPNRVLGRPRDPVLALVTTGVMVSSAAAARLLAVVELTSRRERDRKNKISELNDLALEN
jgi:hypothetical protein